MKYSRKGCATAACVFASIHLLLLTTWAQSHESADTYLEAGLKAAESGDVAEAIARFESAVKLDPAFAEAFFNLGVAYTTQEKQNEGRRDPSAAQLSRQNAIQAFETVLRLDPDLPRVHEALGLLY